MIHSIFEHVNKTIENTIVLECRIDILNVNFKNSPSSYIDEMAYLLLGHATDMIPKLTAMIGIIQSVAELLQIDINYKNGLYWQCCAEKHVQSRSKLTTCIFLKEELTVFIFTVWRALKLIFAVPN